jgi:FtsP/CotA-like multicopper oxidase with cupredoxin domain
MAQGPIELHAQRLPAQAWAHAPKAAFDGTVPGPLLRASQGREFSIRVHNELDEGISIHWHGVRLPNAMDGTVLTQPAIEPGRYFDYVFTPPDAGTFFYRATASRSLLRARGLHGMLVVENAAEESAFDLPLILDDGEHGPLVNGARWPEIVAPAGRSTRVRILNAGAWMPLRLSLGVEHADIIAHDGQAAEALPVTSAAPADPAVAMKPNPLPDYFNYAASHQLPLTIERGTGSGRTWLVNGHQGLSRDPLFSIPRDSTVILTVDNISRSPHVLHLHGHAARVLEIAGRPVARSVWRDTFHVEPLEPAKLLFIADNPGSWLIASTLASIFDEGLQGWFEVT